MIWPLPNDSVRNIPAGGRGFGVQRSEKDKRHAGVDLHARRGDLVVTPEPGRVVNIFPWPSRKQPTGLAIMIESNYGLVFLLAPLEPETVIVGIGDWLGWSQEIGRVGVYPRGSSMLHFEMYRTGTRRNIQWKASETKPHALLNPVPYLSRAAIGHATASAIVPQRDNGTVGQALVFLGLLWVADEVLDA